MPQPQLIFKGPIVLHEIKLNKQNIIKVYLQLLKFAFIKYVS